MRVCRTALVVLSGLSLGVQAAPVEIWPPQVAATQDKNGIKSQLDALDNAAASLPDAVKPAVRFQKVFLRIVSGIPSSAWREEIEGFANQRGDMPVTTGLREISRTWLARLEMEELDAVLRNYYRNHVRFPETLSEVEKEIPSNLQKDPWGGSWIYQPRAPQGFEKLSRQRYQLGPAKFPQLTPLADATRLRSPEKQVWTITPHEIAGNKALEFRSAQTAAILQPGGMIGEYTLLFIGEHWALIAGRDQLFAVSFP